MTTLETIESFLSLFDGRTDAYGAWGGGMVPCTVNQEDRQPIQNHLFGGPFCGVYPVTDDNTTGWGCIDIDGKDHPRAVVCAPFEALTYPSRYFVDWDAMWRIAAELQDVLAYKEVTSWIERTTNGIHIWVFAEERVQASVMRNALLVACQVADYKPREVNPKQTHVSADKPLGNYVRLPYPGALSKGTPDSRFVIDEDGMALTVKDFSRNARGCRTPVEKLRAMSQLYVVPETHLTRFNLDDLSDDAFVLLRPILPPVVEMMFADGPKGDRSATLVRAAVILKDDGWQAQAVFTVLRALDRLVLLKFANRTDPDEPLLKILETVGL